MPVSLPPPLWKRLGVVLLFSQILRIKLLSNHHLQLPLLGGDCFKMIPLHPPKLPLLHAPRLHHSPSFRYFVSVSLLSNLLWYQEVKKVVQDEQEFLISLIDLESDPLEYKPLDVKHFLLQNTQQIHQVIHEVQT